MADTCRTLSPQKGFINIIEKWGLTGKWEGVERVSGMEVK